MPHPSNPSSSDPPKVWTLAALLQWTADFFTQREVDEPRLSAELLLAHALNSSRMALYTQYERVPSEVQLKEFRDLVKQRAAGVPVAYLIGKQWFFSLEFKVTRDVLIPRPDTETLVEQVITSVRAKPGLEAPMVLDLCTGSGCIAIALAKNIPTASVVATDLSPRALAVAEANAATHQVADRISFLKGDLFAALSAMSPPALFHVIASNPPYIPSADVASLPATVRDYEPRLALDGGPDGHHFHKKILAGAKTFLHPGGILIMEMQFDQQQTLMSLYEQSGYLANIRPLRDAAGNPRCIVGTCTA